jgi:hypothetical protein
VRRTAPRVRRALNAPLASRTFLTGDLPAEPLRRRHEPRVPRAASRHGLSGRRQSASPTPGRPDPVLPDLQPGHAALQRRRERHGLHGRGSTPIRLHSGRRHERRRCLSSRPDTTARSARSVLVGDLPVRSSSPPEPRRRRPLRPLRPARCSVRSAATAATRTARAGTASARPGTNNGIGLLHHNDCGVGGVCEARTCETSADGAGDGGLAASRASSATTAPSAPAAART